MLNNQLQVFQKDLTDPIEKQNIRKEIDGFGKDIINKSNHTNNLLSTTLKDFEKGGDNAQSVGTNLADLNIQMKDLDPSGIDFMKTGFLGRFFNPARKYFNRYHKADQVIASIVKSLDVGQINLKNDNITLAREEANLIEVNKGLEHDIELGTKWNDSINIQIQEAQSNPNITAEQIKFVQEEIAFPLKQRLQDLNQMVVVNQQGIVSLNIIQNNNRELIKGVDRAKNITITALRTGAMIASALYNQKIVIDKINALNETTNNIIESTGKMLLEQGSEIHRQSVETTIDPEVLKTAWNDAITALGEIQTYKVQALSQMDIAIQTFNEMARDGEEVVKKISDGNGERKVIEGT